MPNQNQNGVTSILNAVSGIIVLSAVNWVIIVLIWAVESSALRLTSKLGEKITYWLAAWRLASIFSCSNLALILVCVNVIFYWTQSFFAPDIQRLLRFLIFCSPTSLYRVEITTLVKFKKFPHLLLCSLSHSDPSAGLKDQPLDILDKAPMIRCLPFACNNQM